MAIEKGNFPVKTETSRYDVGGIIFIVEPVYSASGETVEDILKKLMKSDVQNDR